MLVAISFLSNNYIFHMKQSYKLGDMSAIRFGCCLNSDGSGSDS